jgi:hypothetical protein
VATSAEPGPRLLRHLRVEDLLLFAWLVLRPLLVPESPGSRTVAGFDPIGGLFDLVALCGTAACLAARRRDATHSGLIRDRQIAYAVGPLFGAVAFAVEDCASRLGLTGGAETLALIVPIGAAIAARLRLPPTTAMQRRALVTPFVLAASGFFGEFLSGFTGLFDLRYFVRTISQGANLAEPLFVFAIGLLGMMIFYLVLVYAPRQIAEREGSGTAWALRFAAFALGLSLGQTLAGMVHGG